MFKLNRCARTHPANTNLRANMQSCKKACNRAVRSRPGAHTANDAVNERRSSIWSLEPPSERYRDLPASTTTGTNDQRGLHKTMFIDDHGIDNSNAYSSQPVPVGEHNGILNARNADNNPPLSSFSQRIDPKGAAVLIDLKKTS